VVQRNYRLPLGGAQAMGRERCQCRYRTSCRPPERISLTLADTRRALLVGCKAGEIAVFGRKWGQPEFNLMALGSMRHLKTVAVVIVSSVLFGGTLGAWLIFWPTAITQSGPSCRTYINRDGHVVPRPCGNWRADSAPRNATASCRVGSYSFSEHRRGTCSHLGAFPVIGRDAEAPLAIN
jgi:hypothetical protein